MKRALFFLFGRMGCLPQRCLGVLRGRRNRKGHRLIERLAIQQSIRRVA